MLWEIDESDSTIEVSLKNFRKASMKLSWSQTQLQKYEIGSKTDVILKIMLMQI